MRRNDIHCYLVLCQRFEIPWNRGRQMFKCLYLHFSAAALDVCAADFHLYSRPHPTFVWSFDLIIVPHRLHERSDSSSRNPVVRRKLLLLSLCHCYSPARTTYTDLSSLWLLYQLLETRCGGEHNTPPHFEDDKTFHSG